MLGILGKSAGRKKVVERLHAATVVRAREPVFFTTLQVPDTFDGRFDLLALHAWLVLERLEKEPLGWLSQGFVDTIFVGFDEGLRDLGTGDMGMGRRIKQLADAFYGRLHAYEASEDRAAMTEVIWRNLYRGAGNTDRSKIVALYVESAREYLNRSDLASGAPDFGPLP
jgi:cytochrome b pre-mRNA-processing protein 3